MPIDPFMKQHVTTQTVVPSVLSDRDLMIRFRMALEAIEAHRATEYQDAVQMRYIATRALKIT